MTANAPEVAPSEGVCRTCARPITYETRTEQGYLPREGWYDDARTDALVCFQAIDYQHVPLAGRERAIYDAGIKAERARVLGVLGDGTLNDHRPSVWRSFSNENTVYRCCKRDFGNATRKAKRGDDEAAWRAWANHALAALRDRIGGSDD